MTRVLCACAGFVLGSVVSAARAQEVTAETLRAVERDTAALLPKAIAATVGINSGGSGVIVTPEGHVLTAHHVAPVGGADVKLLLSDGRQVEARAFGGDKASDTRILKIMEKGTWPFVPMADARSATAVGEWVIGLGHAGGVAKDRPPQVRVGRVKEIGDGSIQTDCHMGPGDSGGPLFNREGQVVGVHKAADAHETAHARVVIYQSAWDRWTKADGESASRAAAISAFRRAAARVERSVVRLRSAGKPVALATVVGADGLLLSKSSEVREPITLEGPGGRMIDVAVVKRSHAHDVVLLSVDPQGLSLQPVTWSPPRKDSAEPFAPGTFVAVAAPSGSPPLAVGVISVGVRHVPDLCFLMGMTIDEVPAGPGVCIRRLTPGGVAEKSGLRVDDVFTHVNKTAIVTRDDLFAAFNEPGRKTISINALRDGKTFAAGFPLVNPGRHATDEAVSRRRNGFPACLQHDADFRPEDCGGPLIDLEGRTVGINIARSSHSMALAIPADVALTLRDKLRAAVVER